jgi:Flp pilus assembly protein TadG
MVTAETAVVLPALLLVLALAVSAVGHVLDVVRVTDAARAGARAAARGETDDVVQQTARQELSSRAGVVRVVTEAGQVEVSVRVEGDPLLPWTGGLRWPDVESTAVAQEEAS